LNNTDYIDNTDYIENDNINIDDDEQCIMNDNINIHYQSYLTLVKINYTYIYFEFLKSYLPHLLLIFLCYSFIFIIIVFIGFLYTMNELNLQNDDGYTLSYLIIIGFIIYILLAQLIHNVSEINNAYNNLYTNYTII